MNTSKSNGLIKLPATLWRRFQYWRGMRIYRRIVLMAQEAERLEAKANRLVGRNVQQPMPLFDRLSERR